MMTVDEVMRYRRAEPFKPFAVELNDGRRFVVREPFHIGRDEASTEITVAAEDESFETFPGTAVARVTVLKRGNAPGRRKGHRP